MAINYPNLPQHLSRDEMGVPDLGSAIRSGMQNAGLGMEVAYKPKNLAEALLHSQLQNKMLQTDIPYRARLHESALRAAQDAHRRAMFETDPNAKIDYYTKLMQGIQGFGGGMDSGGGADMGQDIPGAVGGLNPTPGANQSRDENSQYNFSTEGPGISNSGSAYDTFPGRRAPGKPSAGGNQGGGNIPLQQLMYRAMMKDAVGIDPYQKIPETPEQRMAREIKTTEEKEQRKIDVKTREALEDELPKSQELIERIEKAIPIIEENKDLFGPGVGGLDFLGGPNQRYRGLKDPQKIAAFKHLSNLFAQLQGQQAADFSSRSMKVAFDLAKQAKTSMEDHPEAAVQTLQDMLEKMKSLRQEDLRRYQKAGGKSQQAKRYKYNPETGRLE